MFKNHYIVFGSKGKSCTNSNFYLYFDGARLERVKSTAFFGVYIDDKLTWAAHAYQIFIKVSKPNFLFSFLVHTIYF